MDMDNDLSCYLEFIDNYMVKYISEPNYEEYIMRDAYIFFENIIDAYDEFDEYFINIINFYIDNYNIQRSTPNTYINENVVPDKKIQELKNIYQPEQKSVEWYSYRNNLITASSAWKILHRESSLNDFIYNKCKPFNPEKYKTVNINSPFHWGNKYEDVAVSLYEYLFGVKVDDFGCIKHEKYNFLGASPDGIVVSDKNRGRMLEIKNIVNREITGIPKKEYWIQTQIQMETCDLDECDFLECRFKEYENEGTFLNDGTFKKTADNKFKGIFVQFFDGVAPLYEYFPFQSDEKDYALWYDNIMNKHSAISWVKNIYWYLDEYSCVLIKRNKRWFSSVLPYLEDTWNTVLYEKKNGFQHRKPKKVERKKPVHNTENILFSLNTIDLL
jgi:putative phage-type endonuclease